MKVITSFFCCYFENTNSLSRTYVVYLILSSKLYVDFDESHTFRIPPPLP